MKLSNKSFLLHLTIAAAVLALSAFLMPSPSVHARSMSNLGGRTMKVVSSFAEAGSPATVSIELDSQGDEVAMSFSLAYDAAIFSNPVVTLGSGVPAGSNVSVNPNQTAQGRLGILIDSTNPFLASPPNRQVVSIKFDTAPNAPSGASAFAFVTTPTPLSVSNAFGALLPTVYQVGTVTITPPTVSFVTIGGRVTTPNGQNLRNALVSLIDSNNVRRIATTSSFGLYNFDNVATGQTYTLTVTSKRYRFTPIITTVTGPTSDLNFVGLE